MLQNKPGVCVCESVCFFTDAIQLNLHANNNNIICTLRLNHLFQHKSLIRGPWSDMEDCECSLNNLAT